MKTLVFLCARPHRTSRRPSDERKLSASAARVSVRIASWEKEELCLLSMHILNAIAQKVDVVSDNVLHGRARPSLWGTRKRQRIFLGNAEGMYAYYCIMDNEKTGFNECVCWRTFQFEMNGLRSKHFIFSFSKHFRIHVQCDHDHSIGFHAIHHVNIPQ